MWHWLRSKLTFPLRARRFARELSEELEFHTEMLEADHRRAGFGAAEAAERARAKMGSLALTRQEARRVAHRVDGRVRARRPLHAARLRASEGLHRRGVLFGLAPAWRATDAALRTAHGEGTRSTSGNRGRMTKILVTAQVAVSLVLLIGAGLFIRTLYSLQTQAVGYEAENLLLVGVDPIAAGYRGDDIGRACVELMRRLELLPGVGTVTFSKNGFFTGTESAGQVEVYGFTPATQDDRNTRYDQVGPRYFTNVGIPLLAGRDFTEADGPGRTRVAIVKETVARFYFPHANPIGRHFKGRGIA
jgi:hypothetical protein